jgi:hypothetical protein
MEIRALDIDLDGNTKAREAVTITRAMHTEGRVRLAAEHGRS